MKVGIVGIGAWGTTVARVFSSRGVDLVHDRMTDEKADPLFGERVPWQRMIEPGADTVSAIVATGPPQITATVATACIFAGVPVLATKPILSRLPTPTKAPFYVDYVHLFSPCWLHLKMLALGRTPSRVIVEFYGNGPFRSFSGLEDYGPHAFALAIDLLRPAQASVETSEISGDKMFSVHRVTCLMDGIQVVIIAGNGAQDTKQRLQIEFDGGELLCYEEIGRTATTTRDGLVVAEAPDHDPLGALVDRFLEDVVSMTVNPRDAELSEAIRQLLAAARKAE